MIEKPVCLELRRCRPSVLILVEDLRSESERGKSTLGWMVHTAKKKLSACASRLTSTRSHSATVTFSFTITLATLFLCLARRGSQGS